MLCKELPNGLRYPAGGRAEILFGSRKKSKPEKCLKMRQNPTRQGHAVLGAFCLSQFTHKRTLPKNANQMKNTTKPNSFLARETIRGYTFDTNIHTPLPPASP